MSKIWISSDYHFCHNKRFIWEPRGFKSIEEMNETILTNHNVCVDEDDIVFLLGDIIMGTPELGAVEYFKQLKGKIRIILGNHDSPAKVEQYINAQNVCAISPAEYLHYKKYHFYLSHFPTLTSNNDDKGLKHCTINICGHSHTQDRWTDWDRYNSRIYHAEVDAHNCHPILLDDIIEEMKQKEKEQLNFEN